MQQHNNLISCIVWCLVFVELLVFCCGAVGPVLEKLGAFNYDTNESSPLWWKGKIVIFETMSEKAPDHVYKCGQYFEVRDLLSWKPIVSLEQSCGHSFGAAIVTQNPNGTETMWIFGTRWSGPCPACYVDVFWSNDPNLQVWWQATAFQFPTSWGSSKVFNVDVSQVSPSSLLKFNPGVPSHKWIMILEHWVNDGYNDYFLVNNGTTMDIGSWHLLDESKYFVPGRGGNNIGSCPSIRYVESTGYYYVITGGNKVWIIRSKDLQKWEDGHYNNAAILWANNTQDCKVISKQWSNWQPSQQIVDQLIKNCTKWDTCNSDTDLTQITLADGSPGTLVLFDALDQLTLGYAELALYHGTMDSYLAANFQ